MHKLNNMPIYIYNTPFMYCIYYKSKYFITHVQFIIYNILAVFIRLALGESL